MDEPVEIGITAREDGEFDWFVLYGGGRRFANVSEDFDVALQCVREVVETDTFSGTDARRARRGRDDDEKGFA